MLSTSTPARSPHRRLRYLATLLAGTAVLALTGLAPAAPARADSLIQISGPAGTVPAGTAYTYTIPISIPDLSPTSTW